MTERREDEREPTIDNDVRARVEFPDGTVLEGAVGDYSLGGAKILGSAGGMKPGDQVELVLLFPSGEKVAYQCEVRQLDPGGRYFGVQFKSQPRAVEVHRSDRPGAVRDDG